MANSNIQIEPLSCIPFPVLILHRLNGAFKIELLCRISLVKLFLGALILRLSRYKEIVAALSHSLEVLSLFREVYSVALK